jgi:hypothetical protein
MYLSRVAASHADMSWRSQRWARCASAIPQTGDVADTPRYALHSDATLPDPQWAFGNSACFDLSIPVFISTRENPALIASRVLHGGRIRIRGERDVKRICGRRLSSAGCRRWSFGARIRSRVVSVARGGGHRQPASGRATGGERWKSGKMGMSVARRCRGGRRMVRCPLPTPLPHRMCGQAPPRHPEAVRARAS